MVARENPSVFEGVHPIPPILNLHMYFIFAGDIDQYLYNQLMIELAYMCDSLYRAGCISSGSQFIQGVHAGNVAVTIPIQTSNQHRQQILDNMNMCRSMIMEIYPQVNAYQPVLM